MHGPLRANEPRARAVPCPPQSNATPGGSGAAPYPIHRIEGVSFGDSGKVCKMPPNAGGSAASAGASQPAPLGLPVALEVVDQRRAVEAVRLLARIARHVAAEHVERLGRDAQLAAVGDQ